MEGLMDTSTRGSTLPRTVESISMPSPGPARQIRDAVRLEALGLMTAGIVHDLGNMMQLLQSSVSLIARHPKVGGAEGLPELVAGATSSLERAGGLVQQILSFARS